MVGLAVSLACCGAPMGRLAFAADGGDAQGQAAQPAEGGDAVNTQLREIAGAVSGVESEVQGLRVDLVGHATAEGVAALGDRLDAMAPDVLLQTTHLQAIDEGLAARAESEQTRHDELLERLDAIDGRLQELVTLATPAEVVEDERPPYITLEGVSQLLMVADGLLAVLVGSRAFSALWRVLAGER